MKSLLGQGNNTLKSLYMKFADLKNLAEKNEVPVDNTKDRKRTPPHFFNSLRDAFASYFNTFRTNNSTYESYAMSTSTTKKAQLKILESQFLDVENTVLSMVHFQRFFELFIKDLLYRTNPKLTYSEDKSHSRSGSTWQLVGNIQAKIFRPYKPEGRIISAPFSEILKRFYSLVIFTKDPAKQQNSLVRKFSKILQPYSFLDDDDHKATIEFINWYRNKILHNGTRLPSLRFFDYIVTQRIIPIVKRIRSLTKQEFGDWWYFLETKTGVDILDSLSTTEFEQTNSKTMKQVKITVRNLLHIGHLKELGRANFNMNWLMRRNLRATFEYNYYDPIGRGLRFAATEKEKNGYAKEIVSCPCCGNEPMVIYRQEHNDIFNHNQLLNIDWVKCYTCDYYLRYNTMEPALFKLHKEQLFNRKFKIAAVKKTIQ
jgi:hypothetical protein